MKIIILAFLCFSISSAHADSKDDCLSAEWNQSDSRSQGGGWIWFPGKATSSVSLDEAYLKAEGQALSRMVQECEAPHKETRINERCDFLDGVEHKAFVRIAITDSNCREIKYADKNSREKITHKELSKTFRKYREKIGFIQKQSGSSKKINCSEAQNEKCLKLGRLEYSLENYDTALEYFDEVCRNDHLNGCFNAGLAAWMLNKLDKAAGYFALPCKSNDAQACYLKGKIHLQNNLNVTEAKTFFIKSCSLDNGTACFEIAKLLEKEKQLTEAETFHTKACRQKISDACHEGSRLLYDLGEKEKASTLSKMGCDHKLAKPCFNYAFLTLSKNKPLAVEHFKKACDLGMSLGCERAADHSLKNDVQLRYYLKGCKSGGRESCHKAAMESLDLSDKINFKKLSEEACLLGSAKSCYNLYLLEKKLSNNQQSKYYLELACKDGTLKQCLSKSGEISESRGLSSCMNNSQCLQGYVCATIKGEYPGVCTKSGFGF